MRPKSDGGLVRICIQIETNPRRCQIEIALTLSIARRSFPKNMIKQLLVVTLCSLGAICLRAQTEPEKSPAQPDASRPPTVHDASHTPAQKNPPPVTSISKTNEGAKPKIEKNPPAFDTKNMDKSVKPRRRFLSLRQWRLAQAYPDSTGVCALGKLQRIDRENNDALHDDRRESSQSFRRHEQRECVTRPEDGRRFLRQRHG